MADEERHASRRISKQKRPRGPDRRLIDRRRGGKKANKLFYSNWPHIVVIGVLIFLSATITIQSYEMKSSRETVKTLNKFILESNVKRN